MKGIASILRRSTQTAAIAIVAALTLPSGGGPGRVAWLVSSAIPPKLIKWGSYGTRGHA